MTYGLDVSKETDEHFYGVIFTGKKMLDRIEESRTPQEYRIPKSTEAHVDGFITSASNRNFINKFFLNN
jgi:hypothetical protein